MTKPERKLLTPAEYSRHRGCSRPAVAKALREGRITATAEGLIDPVAADAQWQARTRPRMTMKTKAPATTAPEASHGDAGLSYAEAKRRTAIAEMLQAEREAARQARELVRVEDVTRLWGNQLTICRARLLNIPSRVAPQLPPEHVRQVFELLTEEIHDALTELSRTDGVPASGDEA